MPSFDDPRNFRVEGSLDVLENSFCTEAQRLASLLGPEGGNSEWNRRYGVGYLQGAGMVFGVMPSKEAIHARNALHAVRRNATGPIEST